MMRHWQRAGGSLLLALSPFALGGCEAIEVGLGARMRLDGIALQSISATLQGTPALAPGFSAPLSIVAVAKDGRTLATVGTGDGKVLPDSYRFAASIVTVNGDGVVTLPADPRLSEGRVPHVTITAAGQATPVADLDIPVHYNVPFAATYAGRSGADGNRGADGAAGSNGMMGSFDPNSPSAGGDGGNGGNGQRGGDGGDGGSGPDAHVWIALAAGTHPLLRVRVNEAGNDHFFLVDPAGGSLSVSVRGGKAGDGGSGGQAGQGGTGGAGEPPGNPGTPGVPGSPGQSGRGGAAGHIEVSVDPGAAAYLNRFKFTNTDGDGRPGPSPVVAVAPVPAPW